MSVGGAKVRDERTAIRHDGGQGRGPHEQHADDDSLPIVSLHGATVLLVEDDALNREALELVFSYYGARVVSVDSATAALEQYERAAPAILVSDIVLPDGDGYALLRAIRAGERDLDHRMPAIAISGSLSTDANTRAYAAGFDLFLQKPVDTSALLLSMQRLMEDAGS